VREGARRRLGILGGTFDPVHTGHLILAETAREAADLDSVLFVPSGHSWRKPGREITSGKQRLSMLRLAIRGNERFGVSDIEIRRAGPSYTHVTLAALREAEPAAELFFILGRDALLDLPNWREPARITELATLLVAGRAGVTDRPAAATAGARIQEVPMPLIEISATDIRDRVRRGRSIRYLAPEAVVDYIAQHRLYQPD